jgi:RHS repeat-associated protein
MKKQQILIFVLLIFVTFSVRAQLGLSFRDGTDMAHAFDVGTLGSLPYTDTQDNSFFPFTHIIGEPSAEIYYTFTVEIDTTVDISHCGTSIDSYVHLLNASGTEIAHNDNNGPLCSPSTAASISIHLTGGTYFVVSEGAGYATGAITTSIGIRAGGLGGGPGPGGGPGGSTTLPQLSGPYASPDQNFVTTTQILVPGIRSISQIGYIGADSLRRSVQYLDGLGRPIQTVDIQASSLGNDMVQPIVYDAMGRTSQKLLPYAEEAGSNGQYRSSAATRQSIFYSTLGWDANVVKTPTPYAISVYETSPLGRVIEQGAPGDAWQPGAAHTVRVEYNTNTAHVGNYDVKKYKAAILSGGVVRSLSDSGWYRAGMLYLTITKDENWISGNKGTVEEYKDKENRVILKRTWKDDTTPLSTYYVYDILGNLSFVLTPIAEPDAGLTSSADQQKLDDVCYQYQYDDQSRMVAKKIPGRGWDYFVYNQLDQLVYTQDSVQRVNHQWTWTKRDAQGRVVLTGVEYNNTMSRITVQEVYINTMTGPLWEDRTTSRIEGYTARTHPMAGEENSNIKFLSVNYYDDYDVPGLPYSGPSGYSTMTRGLLTASKVNVLGSSDMLWTVSYYDDKGRITNTYAQHYLGGTGNVNTANYDHVTSEYDFTDQVTKTTRQHYINSSGTPSLALTVVDSVSYDHMGRKLLTWSKINGGTNVLLSKNEYNEIGQVKTKSLHSATGSAPFLQDVAYTYNERGWMTGESSSKFALSLAYNTGITTGATAQYNGNIAEMYSTSDHTSAGSRMKYTYDGLNRLIAADHSNGTLTENGITYDKMGNIGALSRSGASSATLAYTYTGNRLTAVTNGGSAFRTYIYDGNGNATTDGDTKTIVYNMLNLPQSVVTTATSATVATYTYDASGTKIRNTGSSDGTWDYVSGIVYHNGNIEFVQTQEGRAIPNGGSYSYQYNLKDHLGNNRVSMDNTGVLQEDEYYSFGLRNAKYDASNNNRYLYNEKEIQVDLANQYDYGARFYDPVIGRWTSVDPLAEMSRRFSPFVYGNNNPIRFIDPDGMITTNADGSLFTNDPDEIKTIVSYFGEMFGGGTETQKDKPKPEAKPEQETKLKKAKDPLSHKISRWTNYMALGTIVVGLGPEDPAADVVAGGEEVVGQTVAGLVWVGETALDLWTVYRLFAQGKGERGQAGGAGGTNNPFKKLKPDPKKPGNVLETNSQTGKTVSKPAPDGFKEWWNIKHPNKPI